MSLPMVVDLEFVWRREPFIASVIATRLRFSRGLFMG
jgi:hypothetical protein